MNAKEVADIILSYTLFIAAIFITVFLYRLLIDVLSDEWIALLLTVFTFGSLAHYIETRRNK